MPGELWTRTKRRPASVRFRVHLSHRTGTKVLHTPVWGLWVWWRPSRYARVRSFRPNTNF